MQLKGLIHSSRGATGYLLSIALLLVLGCSRTQPELPEKVIEPGETPASDSTEAEMLARSEPHSTAELALGKELYSIYCAACHGDGGDGKGPAARFLYPKPRNFGDAKFRIVTTKNRVPSPDDLMHVIERGMPGSAMFPFGHLTDRERTALTTYVQHLTSQGIEEQLRQEWTQLGETVDTQELAADVEAMTLAGPAIEIPDDWPTLDDKSVSHGRELYLAQGCASCHGDTGKGDGVQEQFDDDGTPTRPRDFTRGIFKGGRERQQLYARIALGMPGTPMPSSPNLEPTGIAHLVNYIQSLSDPADQARVEHKRVRIVAKRADRSLSSEIPEKLWPSVKPIHVVASPLWWRDYSDPYLEVRALHDGSILAVCLTWQDEYPNTQTVRIQDFEDMAAVQLFQGDREPFLGMGATKVPVEVWLWQASWQADLTQYADVDSAYPNMIVDWYPFSSVSQAAGESASLSAPDSPRGGTGSLPTSATATRVDKPPVRGHRGRQPKEFITAWAAGNLRSDPSRGRAASHLAAEGFGTLTERPRVSQIVEAKGTWADGRWTVVFRRPMAVEAGQGTSLQSGVKLSIAFALWDGAAGDRDGQKLVSIWHELEIAP